MPSPQSLKSKLKYILKDKSFSPKAFIGNGFSEYLHQVLDCLNSYTTDLNTQKSKSKKEREKTLNQIFKTFSKIFPSLTESSILNNALSLNSIFSILIHPFSPESIRNTALNLFLQMIVLVDEPNLTLFHEPLTFMIPYNRFSRDSVEEGNLLTLSRNVKPIYNFDPNTSTLESAESQLQMILNFINNNWSAFPKICVHILSKYILSITFHVSVDKLRSSVLGVGFNSPPPEQFVAHLYSFIIQFNDIENDITPISQSIPMLSIFLFFFEETIPNLNKRGMIAVLKFLTSLVKITNLFITSIDSIVEVIKILLLILDNPDPENTIVLKIAERFVLAFFNSIFDTLENEKIEEFFTMIFKNFVDKKVGISFFFGFLLQFFTSNKIKLQKMIRTIIDSNIIYSAVACKYSQYFAIESFSTIIDLSLDEAAEYCNKYFHLKKSEEISSKKDWLFISFKKIHTEQLLMSIPEISFEWEKHKNFQKFLSFVNVPKITSIDQSMITYYISFYDNSTENLSLPLISYFYSLTKLNIVPIEIKYNEFGVISLTFEHLMNIILEQKHSHISFIAFKVLNKLISKNIMRNCLEINALTQWYLIIIIMLLNKREEIRTKAFSASFKAIKCGFSGSQFLIPILIYLIKIGKLKINKEIIGFLSSFPLFINSFNFPDEFLDEVRTYLVNKKGKVLSSYEKILDFKSDNLIDIIISILNKISFNDFPIIITSYITLISFELINEKRNEKYIKISFDKIIEGINQRQPNVLIYLLSSLPIFHLLSDIYSNETNNFIQKVTEICINIKENDNLQWKNLLLFYCSSLYIYNYKITFKSNSYNEFIHFLIETKTSSEKALILLVSYYGLYPFNQSINFATNFDLMSQNIFVDSSTKKFYVPSTNGLTCLNQSGVIHWEFSIPKMKTINKNDNNNKTDKVEINKIGKMPIPVFQQNFTRPLKEVLKIINTNSDLRKSIHSVSTIQQTIETIKRIDTAYESILDIEQPVVNDVKESISPLQKLTPLSLLGIINPLESRTFKMILKNKNSNKFLNEFQDNIARKHLEVGILFMDDKRVSQEQIFEIDTEQTTEKFKEFLLSIGNQIEVPNGYDGFTSSNKFLNVLLYSDLLFEISFHVPSLFKPSLDDPHKTKKMKQILKDLVIIVWIENGRDFDASQIISKTNKVFIVIYPIDNGLFRVDIIMNEKALAKTQIVQKRMLPFLVRSNIIFINEFINPQTNKMEIPSQSEEIEQSLHDAYIKTYF